MALVKSKAQGQRARRAGNHAGGLASLPFNFRFNSLSSSLLVILCAALVLALPHFFRYWTGNIMFPGYEPYYNARMADTIMKHGVPEYDSLSFGGVEYFLDPYHIALSTIGKYFGVEGASRLFPYILGILSALLFYLITDMLKVNIKTSLLSGVILVFSPLFMDIFDHSRSASFALFLFLLAFYLFMQANFMFLSMTVLVLMVLPLFGFAYISAALLILFVYSIWNRRINRFFLIATPSIIFSVLYLLPLHWNFNVPLPNFAEIDKFSVFFAGTGQHPGISIFVIILAIISVFASWRNRGRLWPILLLAALFAIASMFEYEFVYFFNLVVIPMSAYAISIFMRSRWDIQILKNMTLLILLCGMLFHSVSFMSQIVSSGPHIETLEALDWLKTYSDNYSVDGISQIVLSDYRQGYWIEYISGLPAFMDMQLKYQDEADKRHNVTRDIYYGTDLKKTASLLRTHGIGYIIITEEMKNAGVWNRPDQGLLLMLQDNETFIPLFKNKEYEIWKVSEAMYDFQPDLHAST